MLTITICHSERSEESLLALARLADSYATTRAGTPIFRSAEPRNAQVLIPVVGAFFVFHHGKDAVVKTGTPFTAYLDSTSLAASDTP
jgi:hypothetical protein